MLKILLSSPITIDNEIEKVNRLLANDEIDFFHLNKPDFEFSQMNQFLLQIDSSLHHKIMIHSHYSLIEKYDLAEVSINSTDLNQLAYEEEVDKCFIQPMVLKNREIEINKFKPNQLSYSAHSCNEINELPFDTDYAFLSPVNNGMLKIEYQSKLKSLKTKVVAAGCVNVDHELLLKETGFFGFIIQCI